MLALVNGMDVVKSPDLMGGKEYKGHMKNKGISLDMLLLALMFYNLSLIHISEPTRPY